MLQPFAVLRIDHVVLRVSDLERSTRFYEDVVGSRVVRVREDLGLVHLRTGTSMIDLVSLDGQLGRLGGSAPGAQGRNVDHICLRVDPFDEPAIVAHLKSFAITPTGPATTNFGSEGDGLSLYFKDPDGNVIEFKGPSKK
ncbi:MAG: VOC family protein [Steroidobacteraceae bacterium]